MPMDNIVNRDGWVYERFNENLKAQIRKLITPDLVDEHRRNPNGIHSDNLQRVLAYFRRGPIAGKYIVVTEKPYEEYKIGTLTGNRGSKIETFEKSYSSEREVLHAIFLRRLSDIGAK
jgi:branched-chain amino acid transport system permease protein